MVLRPVMNKLVFLLLFLSSVYNSSANVSLILRRFLFGFSEDVNVPSWGVVMRNVKAGVVTFSNRRDFRIVLC